MTGNIALKANQSNVTALSNQLSTNRIADQSTVEAVRSTLTMQISQVRSLAIRGPLPTCTAFSQPTTARWTAACTGGACTVTCRTPYTGTATTINCTTGGWVGMFPRCGQTYSFGAGTTNLATLRSGQSTCGDGQSFKVAHIAGRNEIILADSIADSCLFSGDDLLLLSPTSGHFGVVNVFQVCQARILRVVVSHRSNGYGHFSDHIRWIWRGHFSPNSTGSPLRERLLCDPNCAVLVSADSGRSNCDNHAIRFRSRVSFFRLL